MLGQPLLKQLFHEVKQAKPELKLIDNKDSLIVQTYHHLTDTYGNTYTMDDTKEIALCLYYDYGFLYK